MKSNNIQIFWTLLMSLICCVLAGHSSYLISLTARITKVRAAACFAYQPSSCWQMLALINPQNGEGSGRKTHQDRRGVETIYQEMKK